MNSLIVFCVLSVAAMALARPDGAAYTDKYDNVDLDEILSNRRLLVPYVKCILDQGKCAPDAKELKEHIIEALENECGKCTEAQKKGTRRVIGHLINNEADYWNELTAKFDPEKKYVQKYEKELKEVKA
uniref:Chemosensory protein n=3 Tax=Heliothis virescens TaxID=7102 RepID=A0A2A4JPQ2_HELVI